MVLARCPFCTHTNPHGARFCNECGSPLHLRPCERCQAVNDVLSRQCYRCNAPLRPERALTPIGVATEGSITPALEATTVIAAYGNESAPRRSSAPWLDTHLDDTRASPSIDEDLLKASDLRREPRLGDFSATQVEARDVDAAGARPARYLLALVGILAFAGLAALGSYTFVQRGITPLQIAEPRVPATGTAPSTAEPRSDPAESSPTAGEAIAPPASAASPVSDALPSDALVSEAPADAPAATNAPSASSALTASDAAPATSATAPPTPRTPAPAKRKPAATPSAPSASQDAIETEKIISRELGGASPPSR